MKNIPTGRIRKGNKYAISWLQVTVVSQQRMHVLKLVIIAALLKMIILRNWSSTTRYFSQVTESVFKNQIRIGTQM